MDLNAMFQNLGPAGGSLLTGMQMADATNEQRSQEAMRKAQMDEIMQRTAQNNLMNPLELEAKQQAIAAAKLKANQERTAYRDEVLTKAIPEIEKEPALRRHARLEEIFTQAGLPLDQADRTAFYNMNPDELVKNIKAKHEFNVKNAPDYMKAMAQEELRKTSHLEGIKQQGIEQRNLEGMREASRAKLQKEKLNTVATYEAELAKAKDPKHKAAVALAWALKTADPEEQAIFKQHAKAFEAQSTQLNSQTIAADAQKEAMERLRNKTPITNQPRDLTKGTTKSGIGFTITPTSTD